MTEEKDSYWALMTYFESCKVPLICQAVDLIDSGLINKTYF